MNSIVREKYSILPWFYLFSFLLFLTQTIYAQEVLWSAAGVGARPETTFLGEETKEQLILITSPFGNEVSSIKAADGEKAWSRTFTERIPYPPLPLTESVIVQGDQGTIWALKNSSGESYWVSPVKNPHDYPISPIRFREDSLFTLGRKGILKKIDRNGNLVRRTILQNSWGQRKAVTVPIRSFGDTLLYLDQSGRLTSIGQKTLQPEIRNLWNNQPLAQRAYGRTREILAGAISPDNSALWTIESPGYIASTDLSTNQESWSRKLWKEPDLWSDAGNILAIPTPTSREESAEILLVTRDQVSLLNPENGRIVARHNLPSHATAPPTFDATTKQWWVLCKHHLLRLEDERKWTEFKLPLVEETFSLKVNKNFAIVGSLQGRIYGVLIP